MTPIILTPKLRGEIQAAAPIQDAMHRWIEALRSGNYAQTKHRLNQAADNTDRCAGLCCLGVMCDLADPNGWREPNAWGERSFAPSGSAYTPSGDTFFAFLGVTCTSPFAKLADANDAGASFSEIADFLESCLS